MKYFFVDFGNSTIFSESEERLTFGVLGREPAPEQEDTEASHDPFALDIYVLGKVYRIKLLEVSPQVYRQNRSQLMLFFKEIHQPSIFATYSLTP